MRLSRSQYQWDWLKYSENPLRTEEICLHLDSTKGYQLVMVWNLANNNDNKDNTVNHIISGLQQTSTGVYLLAQLDEEGDPLEIVHITIDHINKWYIHKPETILEIKRRKFSGILRYKWITQSRPEDQMLF